MLAMQAMLAPLRQIYCSPFIVLSRWNRTITQSLKEKKDVTERRKGNQRPTAQLQESVHDLETQEGYLRSGAIHASKRSDCLIYLRSINAQFHSGHISLLPLRFIYLFVSHSIYSGFIDGLSSIVGCWNHLPVSSLLPDRSSLESSPSHTRSSCKRR